MFNWKAFEQSSQILSHIGGKSYRSEWGQHHIQVRPNNFIRWIHLLRDDLDYFTLSDIGCVDRGADEEIRFEVVYNFLNMGTHQRINLHLMVDQNEMVPSIVKYYLHADWMEREQSELFGLRFDRSREGLLLPIGQNIFPYRKDAVMSDWPVVEDKPLPKLKFNPNKSEVPYAEESYEWKKFDLSSELTKGMFEWLVCFDPVRVVDSQINIGFQFQGFEKILQNKDILQAVHLVDRLNLASGPVYSIAWIKTIEEMFRVKIPERAQAIRIVMLELARIADHLTVMAQICQRAELSETTLLINAREKIYELFEKACGHRQGLGLSRMGGLKEDLPYGWIVEYQELTDILAKNLRLIHNSLIGQRRFRELTECGEVNAQSVFQWGVTGPAMRAAGLNFDLRKSQPFYFYRDIDFDIPVGIHGVTYDRYLIRYEEIYQSLRIVTQVMDNLPLGEVLNAPYDINYIELEKFLMGADLPYDWHYSSLEAPGGEVGFLVNLENNLKAERIKIKTPSFLLAAALPVFTNGLNQEQLAPALASLGINPWEMDR